MKKPLALLLSLLMLFSLAACGGGGNNQPASDGNQSTAAPSGDKNTGGEQTTVPELKGPGNVTLKRLGYNAAFDPNNAERSWGP